MSRRAVLALSAFLWAASVRAVPVADASIRFREALTAGDLSKAEAYLKEWADTEPGDEGLTLAQGLWWHAAAHASDTDAVFYEDAGKSASFLEKALNRSPRRLDILLEYCDVLVDINRDEDFLNQAVVASRTSPEGGWLWVDGAPPPEDVATLVPDHFEEVAWGLLRDNDRVSTRLALKLATLCAYSFPGHPGGYRIRARVAMQLGRYAEAKKEWDRVLELAPEDSESWLSLGETLWELEDDKDSRRAYERVWALNNDPDAVRRAKDALDKMSVDQP